jgi:hypothetical protein
MPRYSADVGGSAIIRNGTPEVELPKFTFYCAAIGGVFWGIILARLIDIRYRPPWWQFAPLYWISLVPSIALGFAIMRGLGINDYYGLNDDYGLVITTAGYASFGALFGAVLRSVRLAVFLGLACALTYLISLAMVMYLLPTEAIIGSITQYPPTHISFLHSSTALEQAAIWIAHGIGMGLAVSTANVVLRRDAAEGRRAVWSRRTAA